ncbi:helix-turn-helix domain-containing protein [bacterium]|nr:helix-turn-helix domain-containing protein [bacterium]
MANVTPGSNELKRLGEKIRAARNNQSISLRQFAAQVELSPSYFSKVERGEALAGSHTYELICRKLGLDSSELLGEIGIIDSETQRLFEEQYRANASKVQGLLRKMAHKEEEG